jgi:hypothetical protein
MLGLCLKYQIYVTLPNTYIVERMQNGTWSDDASQVPGALASNSECSDAKGSRESDAVDKTRCGLLQAGSISGKPSCFQLVSDNDVFK